MRKQTWICDNCGAETAQTPLYWINVSMWDGSFIFCSLDCLAKWIAGVIQRRLENL